MKIHYISCHQVLEHDEVQLLTDLGHDVFSNGAYLEPEGHPSLSRPGIVGATAHPNWADLARRFPKTDLPRELIDPFDILIFMGGITDNALVANWPRIRHKKVVWRTIGQSTQGNEEMMAPLRADGLHIIRYSPKEMNIPRYIGADTFIRFYKDENELRDWNGSTQEIVNFSQSLRGRRNHCHYDQILELMTGFPMTKVYGTGNEDLGPLNGGELPWELMKGKLRDARVFVYGGTWPASYTLSFIEAMMTGIPMVCIGKHLAQDLPGVPPLDFYEVGEIIQNGVNGFISDDIGTLRSYIYQLLNDDNLARSIGAKGRETAIQFFGKEYIKDSWNRFLKDL